MPTINNVGNGLSGVTGTGTFVGATSPTLVTPALGTPTSGTLSNCTSATTPTASIVPSWDANKNLSANNFNAGFTTTVSSGAAITLTVSSTELQVITGSTAQTVNLPVATTLVAGQSFRFISTSSNSVTIKTSGGNTLTTLSGTSQATVICVNPSGGTGTASWVATYSIGAAAISQINGDTGSATPSSLGVLTISTGLSTINSGETVSFSGSSTTLKLNVSDANSSTIIGIGAGKAGESGGQVTGLGAFAFSSLTSSQGDVGIGYQALANLTTGGALGNNTAVGLSSLVHIVTGNYNVALGSGAGVGYSVGSESSNIVIGASGDTGVSNEIVIGFQGSGTGAQNKTYIAGIAGATYTAGSPTPYLTYQDTSNGQLNTPTPASSHTVIGVFGSLTLGSALQNTATYAIHVNINIVVTAATTATLIMGVGSTNAPTTDTVVPSFSVAAASNYSMSAIVPAGYYLLVNTTGTITVGSTTTWSCAVG